MLFRVIIKARGNRRSRTGSQWALVLGSGWRAVCPSWRDSNCPGSDTTPGRWLRAPPSISIQLARRPPTEQRAGLGPRAPNNGNNCPCLVQRSAVRGFSAPLISLAVHVCQPALSMQLGRTLSSDPGDSLKSVSTQERDQGGLAVLNPPLSLSRPLPYLRLQPAWQTGPFGLPFPTKTHRRRLSLEFSSSAGG